MVLTNSQRWLNVFAILTTAVTLGLIALGGLVTSHEVGMSVPDWPTTYGYNMFFFPISKWIGGIFYEHTHRLVATLSGTMVVALTRWAGGSASRKPLAAVGAVETGLGVIFLVLAHRTGEARWAGAGHFLCGIGVVVLLAALVWARNSPATRPIPTLAWITFFVVQFQGLLGGLRVVLFKDQIGIFHAALAQIFLALLCAISLMTSRWWKENEIRGQLSISGKSLNSMRFLRSACVATTVLIFLQLILGATMRHQHAGLAIPDFPLAYGRIFPALDENSLAVYNQQRVEIIETNPITPAHIVLQLIHRALALLIFFGVAFCGWQWWQNSEKNVPRWPALMWPGLITLQIILGAATVWSRKAADIATAHVVTGAVSLAFGTMLCIILSRVLAFQRRNSSTREVPGEECAPYNPRDQFVIDSAKVSIE
jgi:cytochrome c oxidase assembly protein subunit 15